jgi:hypothetical protein
MGLARNSTGGVPCPFTVLTICRQSSASQRAGKGAGGPETRGFSRPRPAGVGGWAEAWQAMAGLAVEGMCQAGRDGLYALAWLWRWWGAEGKGGKGGRWGGRTVG